MTRIGHGVRAIEDAALVRRIAAEGIMLEVCPGSNVALGLFPDWAAHPVAALRGAGVPVTLSTDDPPYFHTDLDREYAALADAFGWDAGRLPRHQPHRRPRAFCDAATRAALIARLTEAP